MTLTVKKFASTARLPVRGSRKAIGYDLAACLIDEDGSSRGGAVNGVITLAPGERARVPAGIGFTPPAGTYGRLAPRSGIADRKGIDILAGVIDPDYIDEVDIVMINTGKEPFIIEHDMRVAQLILEMAKIAEVVEVETLEETERGGGGFGSTGMK